MKRTTIFTCSIYPDLTRVWHHFAARFTDPDEVTFVIYDCGSRLRAAHFPHTRIVRHANVDHGVKIDHCVRETVQTPLMFLSDDDAFIVNSQAEPLAAETLMADDRHAAFSFKPREWWEWQLNGSRHAVMGSYSVVFKPEVIRREQLSFRTRPTSDPKVRQGSGYYDTADYANEQLLMRGYRIAVPDATVRCQMVRSYSAVSSGFVNFAKRKWLGDDYRLSKLRSEWQRLLQSDVRKLEWACGVAATRLLYRRLFDESPRFDDFFTYEELRQLAAEVAEPAIKEQALQTVNGYQNLLKMLESLP